MSTIKHAIRNRWTDAVIYEADIPGDTPSGLRARAVLEAVKPARAYLAGAYLADANLAGAYLADANLAGAYLAGAYLADANLAGADLAGANLAGAYLADANLAGANLADANLAGADLAGAKWRDGIVIQKPPIQLYGLFWSVTILDAHMQIGCELHSLADWQTFDDERICEMSGKDALRFWRSHKDALLSLARSAERSFEAVAEPVAA
jgi:hypothetical protein